MSKKKWLDTTPRDNTKFLSEDEVRGVFETIGYALDTCGDERYSYLIDDFGEHTGWYFWRVPGEPVCLSNLINPYEHIGIHLGFEKEPPIILDENGVHVVGQYHFAGRKI
jgi:hypothetical protein